MPRSKKHRHSSGFSLVEMAIVLVIASIALTMGVAAFSAAMANAAHSATTKRQEIIKDALASYVSKYRRLPCPDLPGASGNVPGTGDDNRTTPGNAATVCAAAVGVVPYIDIGLPRESVLDGWDNFFTYAVTTDGNPKLDWTRSINFIPGKLGNLTVQRRDPATSSTTTNVTAPENAAFVLISHGPNGLGAWSSQGTANVAPLSGSDEATNTSGGTNFIQREPSTNTALVYGAFDDQVTFMKPSELIAGLVKDGSIRTAEGETRKVLGDLQEAIIGNSIASATLPASYTMLDDGWGTQLIYTRQFSSQIKASTSPGTATAFTIRSAGANRIDDTGLNDDVVYAVSIDTLKAVYARAGTLLP